MMLGFQGTRSEWRPKTEEEKGTLFERRERSITERTYEVSLMPLGVYENGFIHEWSQKRAEGAFCQKISGTSARLTLPILELDGALTRSAIDWTENSLVGITIMRTSSS